MTLLTSRNLSRFVIFNYKANCRVFTTQIEKAMKLTFILLTVALLHVSATGLSQNVTISVKNAPVEKVFRAIQEQTGMGFLYAKDLVKDAGKVTMDVKNIPVSEALRKCFTDQPLAFNIQNNTIVITKKPEDEFTKVINQYTLANIRGSVIDQDGNPLADVSVTIKGSKTGTTTDANGEFLLAGIDGNSTLVFSIIGYASETVSLKGKNNIKVSLSRIIKQQNEVIIIGYGSVQKKDLTGSVSVISPKDIQDIPFNTVDNALAGKAAGVQVTKSDGTPGGAVRIRVRGSSSLLGGNDPLYVIDGVPMQIQSNYVNPGYTLSSPLGSVVGGGNPVASNVGISGLSAAYINGLNNLGGLNPDDIESITILKDASSTAIYGSKGANGVVIVTTKRGKNDMEPVISGSYYTTISTPYNEPKLLNASQFKSLLTEAAQNQQAFVSNIGFPLSPNADGILNHPDVFFGTANTDWIKAVTRNTVSHNAELSVQGGSRSSKYFSSISFNTTPGIVKATDFQRVSGKLNLENTISPKLRFITNAILGYTNQNIGDNAYAQALLARPDYAPYDNAGNLLNFDQQAQQASNFTNPVALLTATNNAKTFSMLGSLSLIYDFTKDLQFKSSGSLNFMTYNQRNFTPSYLDLGSAYGNVANQGGIGSNSNRRFSNWFLENTLTYNKSFNDKNALTLLVGQSYETKKASYFSATAAGYPNNTVLTSLSSAVTPLYYSGDDPSKPQSYLLSFYARANYSLMDKYLFTFTGRADGSSKFGPQNKYGFFPSGAVAWRLSEEKFLKDVSWINEIKFRGSYGLTGTQNIGDQMYRTLFSPSSYAGTSTLVPTQLGNNNIKWESTKESDAGLDISLFKNRFSATVDYFHRQTSGSLLSFPVAPSSSYSSLLTNAVGIRNTGLEISLAGDIIKTKNFIWSGSVNATFSKSIVTDLNPLADLTQIGSQSGLETQTNFYGGNTTLIKGQPLGILTGQIVTGIIKTADQRNAYRDSLGFYADYIPTAIGDPMYKLEGGSPAYNQIIGYGAPKYYGGITQAFTYKKCSLQFYFTYSVGGHLLWGNHASSTQFQGISNANVSMLDRYYSGNTNATQPQLLLDYSTSGSSNLDVFSSSYLKLRTLTFNYNLGKSKWMKGSGMKNVSVFASATNLFIITKYPGNDPEVSDDTFSVTGGYFDVSNYPSAKTYSIGVKASF